MDAYLKAFWLPKEGSTEEEYEDAFFPRHAQSLSGDRLRFAVADGATEASFSRLWARMLVRAFVRRTLDLPPELDQLSRLREQWMEAVHGKTLPWYAEQKAASGAFSALVAIEFTEEGSGSEQRRDWRAVAAGDSCLFHLTGNKIGRGFPVGESAAFSNSPDLLGTIATPQVDDARLLLETSGNWARRDQFLLMTDALACWFLKSSEEGGKPWLTLSEAEAGGEWGFREFIAKLRVDGVIKNDDVTLMRIELA
jgi:hypothetical protein